MHSEGVILPTLPSAKSSSSFSNSISSASSSSASTAANGREHSWERGPPDSVTALPPASRSRSSSSKGAHGSKGGAGVNGGSGSGPAAGGGGGGAGSSGAGGGSSGSGAAAASTSVQPGMLDDDTLKLTDEGWLRRCFPTKHPAGRREVLELSNTFERMLLDLKATSEADKDLNLLVERELHVCHTILHEITRQVAVECTDRGVLLEKVKTRYWRLFNRVPPILHFYRSQVERLSEANQSLKNMLKKLAQDKMLLEGAMNEREADVAGQQQQQQEVSRQLANFQATVNATTSERDQAQEELRKSRELLAWHDAKIKDLQAQLVLPTELLKSVYAELEDARNDLHKLQLQEKERLAREKASAAVVAPSPSSSTGSINGSEVPASDLWQLVAQPLGFLSASQPGFEPPPAHAAALQERLAFLCDLIQRDALSPQPPVEALEGTDVSQRQGILLAALAAAENRVLSLRGLLGQQSDGDVAGLDSGAGAV